jgi:hypothetical protein
LSAQLEMLQSPAVLACRKAGFSIPALAFV